VEHFLYETLGLLIPGALFALATTVTVAPDTWPSLIKFMDAHWVIACITVYTIGYVVQGISRRVTSWCDAVLVLPLRCSVRFTGLLHERAAARLKTWLRSCNWSLLQRAGWPPTQEMASLGGERPGQVDLKTLVADRLCVRLGLPLGSQLRPGDLRDLAFSALLSERRTLDRFRAATSFARAAATVVALGDAALLAVLLLPRWAGGWPTTSASVTALGALTVAYLALMERSSMYDTLWSSIIVPQFLITTTRDVLPPGPRAGPAGASRQHAAQSLP